MLKSEPITLPKSYASTKRVKKRDRTLLQTIWSYRVSYLFIAPFMICFILFIFLPVLSAIVLSFTYYNSIEPPDSSDGTISVTWCRRI